MAPGSRLTVGLAVLWSLLAAPAFTQVLDLQTPAPAAAPTPEADPLGRTAPRGTITGFIVAVRRGDPVSAARFMQIPNAQRSNAARLASDLSGVMDRYLSQPFSAISDAPAGSADDGLAFDRERVGPLTINGESIDIILVRVNDPEAGSIWLVSSETVARVPEMHRALEASWLERVMPRALLRVSAGGLSAAHWLAIAASLLVPWLLWFALSRALQAAVSAAPLTRAIGLDVWYASIRRPLVVLLTLAVHLTLLRFIGIPLSFRISYGKIVLVASIVALAWLARRLSASSFDRARALMDRRRQTSAKSLLLLSERLVNVLIVVVGIFGVLTAAGVDTATALAGVGIGGIAIALGAQKTIENLMGGVFLLSDNVLAVGDMCAISGREGTIEDITLRSVRLRTVEQTLLSVPAGALAQASIENFASRTKILARTTLRLSYGPTAEEIRTLLAGLRSALAEDPDVEAESSRVRLVDFGIRGVEFEVFAYVLTPVVPRFLEIREGLLLRLASVVEQSGCRFSQPADVVLPESPSALRPDATTPGRQ